MDTCYALGEVRTQYLREMWRNVTPRRSVIFNIYMLIPVLKLSAVA